jgi:hypothetical protein
MKAQKVDNLHADSRWDLIPSEILDLLYEAGIARDISCDLIEALPDDLWPQIQLASIKLDPNSAKICNAITVILAYLMQHEFKLALEMDVQLGSAFQFLQGKVAELRIKGQSDAIDAARQRLDEVISVFFDEFYHQDNPDNVYRAANEAVH